MASRKSWEKYLLFVVRQMPADVRSEFIDIADEVVQGLVNDRVIVFSHPYDESEDAETGETLPLLFH